MHMHMRRSCIYAPCTHHTHMHMHMHMHVHVHVHMHVAAWHACSRGGICRSSSAFCTRTRSVALISTGRASLSAAGAVLAPSPSAASTSGGLAWTIFALEAAVCAAMCSSTCAHHQPLGQRGSGGRARGKGGAGGLGAGEQDRG